MSSVIYGPDETWPSHPKKHWAEPLKLARDKGWTLVHLDASHKFGVARCPQGEHTFMIDSTARGSETKAIEAKKNIQRCTHGAGGAEGSRTTQRQEQCADLLGHAEQLIAVAATELDRMELQDAAWAEIERLELQLASADANLREVLAAQDDAFERAAGLDPRPDLDVVSQRLDEAEAKTGRAVQVVGRIGKPRIASPLQDRADRAARQVGELRERLSAIQNTR